MAAAYRGAERRVPSLRGTYDVTERFLTLEGKVDRIESKIDRLWGAILFGGFLIGILEPIIIKVVT